MVIHFSLNEGPNSSQNREISGQVSFNNRELFKFRIIIIKNWNFKNYLDI